MPRRPPSQIHQYTRLQELGAGAGGVVYRAYDTRLDRPVVLKLLHPNVVADDEQRRRVLEEARMASAIDHPNVASIFEVGEVDERPFIVMPYLAGRTLQEVLDEGRPPIRVVLSVGIQIADGLAAAHALGIIHRDLKPANVMLQENGLVKILDFGLARRVAPTPDLPGAPGGSPDVAGTRRFGTTAYMAPEQFVTLRSTPQSDLFSLGVVLYQMVTGMHPFASPGLTADQLAIVIQNRKPEPPRTLRPDLPEPIEAILLRLLEKQPANRYRHAIEVRDALRAAMRSLHLESGGVPGEASAVLPALAPDAPESARPRLFSAITNLFAPDRVEPAPSGSLAVLPFRGAGPASEATFSGLALADAVAARLARATTGVVRPPSALLSVTERAVSPMEAGRRLAAERVLTATIARTDEAVMLTWQLIDVSEGSVLDGGTLDAPAGDAVAAQEALTDALAATLDDWLNAPRPEPDAGAESETLPDDYLDARAVLTSYALRSHHHDDLDLARVRLEAIVAADPDFAPAHAGLGIAHLLAARDGVGGQEHLILAQEHLERALALDPTSIEARLNRSYALLWQGEKAQARREVQQLLHQAPANAEVQLGAALALTLDGLLEEALVRYQRVLALNPAAAPRVYNGRARLLLYQGRKDEAWREIERGLALAPTHYHLRTTCAHWLWRYGDPDEAIRLLEAVIEENPAPRLAHPTLAIAYVKAGRRDDAAALMSPEMLAAAKIDGEMAYRLATYYVARGSTNRATRWLRRAIYLGNENYTWFAVNSAWAPLADNETFRSILSDLRVTYERNAASWRSALAPLGVRPGAMPRSRAPR